MTTDEEKERIINHLIQKESIRPLEVFATKELANEAIIFAHPKAKLKMILPLWNSIRVHIYEETTEKGIKIFYFDEFKESKICIY
jgi:hypothetical protein